MAPLQRKYTAFLVTHNPDHKDWRPWTDLPEDAARVAAGQRVTGRWRFYNASVQPGDLLFWLRQHRRPQGIFASGRATSERTADGYVKYELDELIDPSTEEVLPVSQLQNGALGKIVWGTNRSGIRIPPEAVAPLERAWARHLRASGYESNPTGTRADYATRQLLERFLGRGARGKAAASALVRSISEAHKTEGASWIVTISEKRLRLNVGMPYVLDLNDGGFRLVVQNSPASERKARQFGRDIQQTPYRFKRAPRAVVYEGHAAIFEPFYNAMWPYHGQVIREVASDQRRSPHQGHSPAVLEYLRGLGHSVPEPTGRAQERRARSTRWDEMVPPFNPTSLTDGRRRILMAVAQRQGQGAFRRALLDAYEGRCAITGCSVESVLEAAHIYPYRGRATNHVRNGLLLRADLHTLFDLGELSLDRQFTVKLSPQLKDSPYGQYDGRRLRLPRQVALRPDPVALERRRTLLNEPF